MTGISLLQSPCGQLSYQMTVWLDWESTHSLSRDIWFSVLLQTPNTQDNIALPELTYQQQKPFVLLYPENCACLPHNFSSAKREQRSEISSIRGSTKWIMAEVLDPHRLDLVSHPLLIKALFLFVA